MARLLTVFLAWMLIAGLVCCNPVIERDEGAEAPPDALLNEVDELDAFGEIQQLDGRGLIDSWLNKRQRVCTISGYSLCNGKLRSPEDKDWAHLYRSIPLLPVFW